MTRPDRDPRSRSPTPATSRGKRVVLTGASRGLGELLAHAFSQAGARVALVARTEADLKARRRRAARAVARAAPAT